jgi:hypothetical protein
LGTSFLVLRGLPFTVTKEDIISFIQGAGAYQSLTEDPVSLLSNRQGRPSGFAEVKLAHASDFWDVHEKLHMQRLGGRYIEVLPPRLPKDVTASCNRRRRWPERNGGRHLSRNRNFNAHGTPRQRLPEARVL